MLAKKSVLQEFSTCKGKQKSFWGGFLQKAAICAAF
jgi:hypothetical protein